MPRAQWETDLEELATDTSSGAAELEGHATGALRMAVIDSIPGDVDAYRQWLMRAGRRLISARPSMAGIFRLVNDMLWACSAVDSASEMRATALTFLDERQVAIESAVASVAAHASEVLAGYSSVMTYSRSSTVLRALLHMVRAGKETRAICGEGRPALEGQLLAIELGSAGVPVTLGTDMALFGWLSQAEALVVGADSISSAGFVNKVGTGALMNAAAARDIPRIVLSTSTKFLPEGYSAVQELRNGDPDEVMPATQNVTVLNPYFEIVPLDEASLLVCEDGPLRVQALVDRLRDLRIYPGLMGKRTSA